MNIKTQEALKMAIIVMQAFNNEFPTNSAKEAIQACKEALAQPAQEPVAVQYLYKTDPNNPELIPLYTHPAPSWQGLSDDEIEVIDADCWVYPADGSELFNHYKFARAIEQASKEKNTC